MENTIDYVTFYNKGDLTQFALEKELSLFLGDRCEVQIITSPNTNTANSFTIFAVPELRSNGFYLNVFIDKVALSKFSTEELLKALENIKVLKLMLFRKMNEFLRSSSDHTVNETLGCLLKIYQLTLDAISTSTINTVPDREYLDTFIQKLEDGVAAPTDIEKLLVDDVICSEILELAKKISGNYKETMIPDMVIPGEVPSFNLNRENIRSIAKPTLGDVQHHEIDYNYKPSTNQ